MNRIIGLFLLSLCMSGTAQASDSKKQALQEKVQEKVAIIEQSGLILTAQEVESVESTIVDDEVSSTSLTVDDAVLIYDLSTDQERLLKIKEASRSNGGGINPN